MNGIVLELQKEASLRCGRPEVENGDEKIRMLIQSAEVQRVIGKVGL